MIFSKVNLKFLKENHFIIKFFLCLTIINQVMKDTEGITGNRSTININAINFKYINNNNNKLKINNNNKLNNNNNNNRKGNTVVPSVFDEQKDTNVECNLNKNFNNITNISYLKNENCQIFDNMKEKSSTVTVINNDNFKKIEKLLSRKRRYVAFPEGSSFSVAVCATVGVIGSIFPSYLAYGLNWGVSYDLPNKTWVTQHVNGIKNLSHSVKKRRYRRDIFNAIEIAVNNMGYNGRNCVLRALCEGPRYLRKGKNMIEEILKTIFSFPNSRVSSYEHSDVHQYHKAYRKSVTMDQCSELYECGFSLIDLAMGKYSTAPAGVNFG